MNIARNKPAVAFEISPLVVLNQSPKDPIIGANGPPERPPVPGEPPALGEPLPNASIGCCIIAGSNIGFAPGKAPVVPGVIGFGLVVFVGGGAIPVNPWCREPTQPSRATHLSH